MKRPARTTTAGRCQWCGRARRRAPPARWAPSPHLRTGRYKPIERRLTPRLSQPKSDLSDFGRLKMPNSGKPEFGGRGSRSSPPPSRGLSRELSVTPIIKRPKAKEASMTRADLTEKILDIKREKGWSWKYIHEKIGGTSPVLLVGALLGQMKLTKPQAANAAELFGLSKSEG